MKKIIISGSCALSMLAGSGLAVFAQTDGAVRAMPVAVPKVVPAVSAQNLREQVKNSAEVKREAVKEATEQKREAVKEVSEQKREAIKATVTRGGDANKEVEMQKRLAAEADRKTK